MRQVVFIVGVLFALATAGCGGDSKKSAGTTTVTTTVANTTNQADSGSVTTHGKYKYPPVVINNFMQSCQNGMNNRRAYCACTLDKLSSEVSVQDFARIGLAGGKLPPRIRNVIEEASIGCADKL
ncbi:hypothetical protein BH18ACT12_BH18ACT12_00200 [soil metagenome]